MCDDIKFSVLCSLFDWIQRSKSSAQKRSKVRKFLDHFCKPGDYFGAIRLILPALDRERGSYGLKESVLATCLIDALGISRDSQDAVRLINWRKGGPKTGSNVGNFSLVAAEVLQSRQGMTTGGLMIRELNELLDRLASCENRAAKTSVLADLIRKTNAQEMKWILMIILKDLKLGVSEKSIFHEFHPDAEDLFNVTCDLKLVCEKLRDRSQRHKRQDIEVGKAIRPQLAMRVGNVAAARKKLHGKEVVVECKFDGDRIQIHKNGADIHFFSRNFLDHTEYGHAMSDIIIENVLVDRCILDGEMLVWDTSTKRFAEFGSNQEIAKAAREGLDDHRQLCYVAFDILYVKDTSVIHQSLKERQELLRKVVKPSKGRLEILVPDGGLNTYGSYGEPWWSLLAHSADDVERFFKGTIENRDEGIVIKDLGSRWEPGDRSSKWLKLKPEYIHTGSDLDVLIIGGYYGSGRRGGEVTQFLLGLAEKPAPNTYPRRFISFCRVGTGLSDEELDELVTKLKPHFREYEYPKKAAPSFYQVTNNSKERPDVWIESPEKSIILSITSDIRTIRSEVFSAPYSLRFPRIDRVRYDKPWHNCLDVQSFMELVYSSNGTVQRRAYDESLQYDKPKRSKSLRRGDKKKLSLVPPHFVHTDVSNVKGKSFMFSDLVFYIANVPPNKSLDELHKMVTENGGTFSMNLNDTVTHCVAAESKGIKYEAAKCRRDVIHCSWVLDCCSQKKLVPLQPKFFLFLSKSSKKKLQEEIDEFSDSYFCDLNTAEFKQILGNAKKSEDTGTVEYYKRKYCPKSKWSLFHGCCIYFHLLLQFPYVSCEGLLKLVLRRMTIDVSMGGGRVRSNLSEATHVVVISVPGYAINFETLLESFPREEKHVLSKKRLHVVRLQWLEDCLKEDLKLLEKAYSLKPNVLEESSLDEGFEVNNHSKPASPRQEENPRSAVPSKVKKLMPVKREPNSKRGRPHERKAAVSQPQRMRARLGSRPAKLYEDESGESIPSDKASEQETESDGVNDSDDTLKDHSSEILQNEQAYSSSEPMSATDDTKYACLYSSSSCKPNNGSETVNSDKLEVMVDPVQAMLLDMIPSLGAKKTEITSPIKKNDELAIDQPKAEPSEDPAMEPVKKKKRVSYKDVAGELLKDW
ncbi:hypothetical protein Nepgr_015449 [Nepenthes gracilis]|uniref:DNA ligase n=1 Tax=Nepenthes gracilis TaxID=150966 RepID=A0AAD3SL43_NEPGR|nr:hypothetical protein Nepgr_015449 [Nepenthes gracilis]